MYWPGIFYEQCESHYDLHLTNVYDARYTFCKGYMRVRTETLHGKRAAHILNYIRARLLLFLYLKPLEQSGSRYMRNHVPDMYESVGDIPTRGLPFRIKIPALKGINCPGFRPLAGLN